MLIVEFRENGELNCTLQNAINKPLEIIIVSWNYQAR